MRVEQLRGGVVEAVHDVHAAVLDAGGRLVARAGDPDLVTFWRSAGKPIQALPLVEDGVADRFAFTSEELALVCASHSSEPGQVARVRELLGKIGCGVVCFGIPLRAMALAYARLSNAEFGMPNAESTGEVARGTTLTGPFRIPHSALRIVEAMLRHPDLIAGEGRPCTELMRAHPGRVVVKVVAEGVYCALLPR